MSSGNSEALRSLMTSYYYYEGLITWISVRVLGAEQTKAICFLAVSIPLAFYLTYLSLCI